MSNLKPAPLSKTTCTYKTNDHNHTKKQPALHKSKRILLSSLYSYLSLALLHKKKSFLSYLYSYVTIKPLHMSKRIL